MSKNLNFEGEDWIIKRHIHYPESKDITLLGVIGKWQVVGWHYLLPSSGESGCGIQRCTIAQTPLLCAWPLLKMNVWADCAAGSSTIIDYEKSEVSGVIWHHYHEEHFTAKIHCQLLVVAAYVPNLINRVTHKPNIPKSNWWNRIIPINLRKKIQTPFLIWKTLATLFWDQVGPLLVELLPWHQTINAENYCDTIQKLSPAIQTISEEC